jgi:uncharacterized protein (DUF433 family)
LEKTVFVCKPEEYPANEVAVMTIPSELKDVLDINPKIISGAVRFKGTRVPVQALIDTLDGGTLSEFLHGWPDVTKEQAEAVIHWEQNVARKTFGLELAD